jgi:hypothetical protein
VLSGQDTRGIYAKLVYELGAMLGIGSNLKILPNLAPKRKPLLYAAADVFVSPVDNIQETFGLALLEAMATGLPVVASDWSGYRDIVRNGTEGFLIPTYWSSPSAETAGHYSPVMDSSNEYYLAQHTLVDTKALYERLRLLVRNPELRQQLGAAGSARARAEFSWRAVIHKFGALWSQQLEDCRIKMSEPRSAAARPSFDYDSMFSHYATEILDNQDIITLDREITDCAQLLRNRISGLTSESLAASIIEVVEKCYPGSKPLGDVLTKGNRISLDAVLWLLKKGFCHISPASTD